MTVTMYVKWFVDTHCYLTRTEEDLSNSTETHSDEMALVSIESSIRVSGRECSYVKLLLVARCAHAASIISYICMLLCFV